MKNQYLVFIVLAFILNASTLLSQQITIANQITFGGNNDDIGTIFISTKDNGFMAGGYSISNISGNKTENSRGFFDYWVVKYDSLLQEEWQKTIGGDDFDDLFDIIETHDGGFLLGGVSASNISGDKTVIKKGLSDYWIVKLDNLGNILWQNTYGGDENDNFNSFIELADGRIILVGSSDSPISGDKTDTCRGYNDYWVVCIDENGNKLWDKTYGGTLSDGQLEIIKMGEDALLISGKSTSNISGEKTENSYGENDVWLLKLDLAGNKLWDKTIGSNSTDDGIDITCDNNYIYIAVASYGGISGLKTENSRGDSDFWIIKMDNNGEIIWDKTLGGDLSDIPSKIKINSDNNLIVFGSSRSSISGDKTENSKGLRDFWLLCMDTTSQLIWQKTIGGSNFDYSADFCEKNLNEYYIFGYSNSGISGDKTDACLGYNDFWILELNLTTGITNEIEHDSFITLFPNPASTQTILQFENNKYEKEQILIYNTSGTLAKQLTVTMPRTNIAIDDLPKGLYLIKIGKITRKLVVE